MATDSLDHGKQFIDRWDLLAVLQPIRRGAQGQGADPVDGLIRRRALHQDAREFGYFRDPPSVLFLFQVDPEFHATSR